MFNMREMHDEGKSRQKWGRMEIEKDLCVKFTCVGVTVEIKASNQRMKNNEG